MAYRVISDFESHENLFFSFFALKILFKLQTVTVFSEQSLDFIKKGKCLLIT